MSHHIRIDTSDRSAVVICTCGWRDIATSGLIAARMGANHEAACHPGQRQAYKLYDQRTRPSARQMTAKR